VELDRLLDGRLKVRHLVLVTTIAEHGSIMRAAEHLRVTQPVVTRGLRELETILGVELFDRGARGVAPTAYGTAFIGHARATLAEIRLAGKHLDELRGAQVGTVAVGTYLAGSNVLLPKAIAAMRRDRPRVTVVVKEATPDVLTEDLLAGRIDLVVGRLTPADDEGRTTRIRLYSEPVRVVVRAGHPAIRLTEPKLADLVDFPWILPAAQTVLRHELEQGFFQEGLELPVDRVECSSILTTRALLAEDDFVATMLTLVAADDDRLVALSTPLPLVHRLVGVTVATGRTLNPSAELLLVNLRTAAEQIRRTLDD
jgi:DNA-binding transcriptional LysR family regulator